MLVHIIATKPSLLLRWKPGSQAKLYTVLGRSRSCLKGEHRSQDSLGLSIPCGVDEKSIDVEWFRISPLTICVFTMKCFIKVTSLHIFMYKVPLVQSQENMQSFNSVQPRAQQPKPFCKIQNATPLCRNEAMPRLNCQLPTKLNQILSFYLSFVPMH